MQIVNLYRYESEGAVYHALEAPEGDCTLRVRLIADEGKVLTCDGGATLHLCIDADSADGWEETDMPEDFYPAEEAPQEPVTPVLPVPPEADEDPEPKEEPEDEEV